MIHAGSTLPKGLDSKEDFSEESTIPHTWTYCNPQSFHLRVGPNYKKTKCKAPSPNAFYEIVGIDFVKCSKRVDNFGSKVTIPEEWMQYNSPVVVGQPIFVVNVQIPSDFSTSFFKEITDGEGWSLALYFRLTEETMAALGSEEPLSPALQLLKNYIDQAPEVYAAHGLSNKNPWIGRFKITIRIENVDQFGLPSFITAYNAKPVLIRHTGTLLRGDKYVEMDINVHKFSSLPKKALEVLFNRFETMVLSVGFCIESIEDNEMPETLLGCFQLNKPNHSDSFNWNSLA